MNGVTYEYMFMYDRCKCSKKSNCCRYTDNQMSYVEKQLKLVSVKTRLNLLFLLENKTHCVSDLMKHTNLSQSLISHHLSDLEKSGFVNSKKNRRFVEYSLTQKGKEIIKNISNIVEKEVI